MSSRRAHGVDEVRILEFFAPGPLSGNTQAYARTQPKLTTFKRTDERWLGRWPRRS